jgi:hypothetical protein
LDLLLQTFPNPSSLGCGGDSQLLEELLSLSDQIQRLHQVSLLFLQEGRLSQCECDAAFVPQLLFDLQALAAEAAGLVDVARVLSQRSQIVERNCHLIFAPRFFKDFANSFVTFSCFLIIVPLDLCHICEISDEIRFIITIASKCCCFGSLL